LHTVLDFGYLPGSASIGIWQIKIWNTRQFMSESFVIRLPIGIKLSNYLFMHVTTLSDPVAFFPVWSVLLGSSCMFEFALLFISVGVQLHVPVHTHLVCCVVSPAVTSVLVFLFLPLWPLLRQSCRKTTATVPDFNIVLAQLKSWNNKFSFPVSDNFSVMIYIWKVKKLMK